MRTDAELAFLAKLAFIVQLPIEDVIEHLDALEKANGSPISADELIEFASECGHLPGDPLELSVAKLKRMFGASIDGIHRAAEIVANAFSRVELERFQEVFSNCLIINPPETRKCSRCSSLVGEWFEHDDSESSYFHCAISPDGDADEVGKCPVS